MSLLVADRKSRPSNYAMCLISEGVWIAGGPYAGNPGEPSKPMFLH